MPVGEFTKYGLVFGSSLIGAVGGYFYSSKPLNLRMRMERNGTLLLRPSDPLWMYRRLLKQHKTELKEVKDIVNMTPKEQAEVPKTDLEKLREFANSDSRTEPTDVEAIALINWCESKLATGKYSSTWEKDVAIFCAYPSWS